MPGHGGTGGTPTGNAMTDAQANAAAAAAATQVADAVNAIALAGQGPGSDCLWPPPSIFGSGAGGFLGGLLSVTFSTPCLFTKSEARAVFGAGLILGGLLIMWGGFEILAVGEALPWAAAIVGIRSGGKAKAAAKAPAKTASDVELAA